MQKYLRRIVMITLYVFRQFFTANGKLNLKAVQPNAIHFNGRCRGIDPIRVCLPQGQNLRIHSRTQLYTRSKRCNTLSIMTLHLYFCWRMHLCNDSFQKYYKRCKVTIIKLLKQNCETRIREYLIRLRHKSTISSLNETNRFFQLPVAWMIRKA